MLNSPGDTWVYRLAHVLLSALFVPLYRMEVKGLEHVPRHGGVVVASNHVSNIDPVFLGVACRRQIHFMAKSELWKFKPLAWLVEGLGAFSVRRGAADRDAVRRALELLDEQAVVGIFPEGRRQPVGRLGDPQPGVALFSLRPGVTTVPVVLRGTDQVMRGRRPGFPRVSVTFGPPVPALSSGGAKAERHREFASRLMGALQSLLDQTSASETPLDPGEDG